MSIPLHPSDLFTGAVRTKAQAMATRPNIFLRIRAYVANKRLAGKLAKYDELDRQGLYEESESTPGKYSPVIEARLQKLRAKINALKETVARGQWAPTEKTLSAAEKKAMLAAKWEANCGGYPGK